MKVLFGELLSDLEEKGPVLSAWPNYSKLGKDKYQCRLAYRWVACWTHEAESILIDGKAPSSSAR